jgi:hypothetical protein
MNIRERRWDLIERAQEQARKEIENIEDTNFHSIGEIERYLKKNLRIRHQIEMNKEVGRIEIIIFDETFDYTKIQKYLQDRVPIVTQIIFSRRSKKNKLKFISK